MFRMCIMFSNNHGSRYLNRSFNKEEPVEDLGVMEEALVEEEDEVRNPFSVIPMGYSGTIKENVLMCNLHTM